MSATVMIYTSHLDRTAQGQLDRLISLPPLAESHIALMPDAHASSYAIVGFTATMTDKIIPNIVGGDIGCGVLAVALKLGKRGLDFPALDKTIHRLIPAGLSQQQAKATTMPADLMHQLENMNCWSHLPGKHKLAYSFGTLGGGNHFIEIDQDVQTGTYWLLIHTGSRSLGQQVNRYYQDLAGSSSLCFEQDGTTPVPHELCWVAGEDKESYLADQLNVAAFAAANRRYMAQQICKAMKWKMIDSIDTPHNFVDASYIRKGAVPAILGQRLVIPLNMAAGSLYGEGKGNKDWNESAPHGAGRLLSRQEAKETLTMVAYKQAMKNVWSSSVTSATLDEAPGAYKDPQEIATLIKPTVTVRSHWISRYNFKSGQEG